VTQITYGLPGEARVRVVIHDVVGREVAVLVNERQAAGHYRIAWNGTNFSGTAVSSGVYFYRMEARPADGGRLFSDTKKMLLIR